MADHFHRVGEKLQQPERAHTVGANSVLEVGRYLALDVGRKATERKRNEIYNKEGGKSGPDPKWPATGPGL
ncbi:MAG: hypothetical protein R3B54_17125 [Bdellovibrionota bacterium]